MQSQIKQGPVLTPKRFNTLFTRAQSQPTRIRTTQKIKINLRKLPNDFFTGNPYLQKINNITKIKSRQEAPVQTQGQFNEQFLSNTINFRTQRHYTENNKRQFSSFKKEKPLAVSRAKNNRIQADSQNKNSMNWTFSRNFGLQQYKINELKNKTIKVRTQRSRTIETQAETKVELQFYNQNICKKQVQSIKAINSIISDKISQMNVNRLRINVRKNNHPLQAKQIIKKYFG